MVCARPFGHLTQGLGEEANAIVVVHTKKSFVKQITPMFLFEQITD